MWVFSNKFMVSYGLYERKEMIGSMRRNGGFGIYLGLCFLGHKEGA